MSEIKAKDFLGNEINVGDEVVTMELQYRNFIITKVTKITKCFCFLSYIDSYGYEKKFKQMHEQVIVKK